jgi:hypothetical protein
VLLDTLCAGESIGSLGVSPREKHTVHVVTTHHLGCMLREVDVRTGSVVWDAALPSKVAEPPSATHALLAKALAGKLQQGSIRGILPGVSLAYHGGDVRVLCDDHVYTVSSKTVKEQFRATIDGSTMAVGFVPVAGTPKWVIAGLQADETHLTGVSFVSLDDCDKDSRVCLVASASLPSPIDLQHALVGVSNGLAVSGGGPEVVSIAPQADDSARTAVFTADTHVEALWSLHSTSFDTARGAFSSSGVALLSPSMEVVATLVDGAEPHRVHPPAQTVGLMGSGAVLSVSKDSKLRVSSGALGAEQLPGSFAVPSGSVPMMLFPLDSSKTLRTLLTTWDGFVVAAASASSWTRDESFSRVLDVVSVEPVRKPSEQLSVEDLGFFQRMEGQVSMLKDLVQNVVSALTELSSDPQMLLSPHTSSAFFQRSFPSLNSSSNSHAFDRTLVFVGGLTSPGAPRVLSAMQALPQLERTRAASDKHVLINAYQQPTVWRRSVPFVQQPGDVSVPTPSRKCGRTSVTPVKTARTPAGDPLLMVVEDCGRVSIVDAWTGAIRSSHVLPGAVVQVAPTGALTKDGVEAVLVLHQSLETGSVSGTVYPGPLPADEAQSLVDAISAMSTVITSAVDKTGAVCETDRDAAGVAGFRLHSVRVEGGFVRAKLERLWASVAPSETEQLVAFSLPASLEWQRSQASEMQSAKGMADGSLLLEHKEQLVTMVTGPLTSPSTLTVRLLDAATGHVAFAVDLPHASGPAQLTWYSDTLALAYWNAEYHRFELAVTSLFGAEVGAFDLNPLSKIHVSLDGAPPVTKQRTYILPAPPSAIGTTHTHRGITPHALLLALEQGSVLQLDKRIVDPRRPVGDATPNDKAEGLEPYTPYLPLPHTLIVTHRHAIPRLSAVRSMPTLMESASVVVATGLDVSVTRVTPASRFDALDPAFSFQTVVGLLVAGVAAVAVAKNLLHDTQLEQAWQ